MNCYGTELVLCVCETQGQGLSKAMTAQEAQAFVGDKQCVVTVLHDDKLFLEAPSTPPKARSRRQRRDTSSETLDLVVSSGFHSSVHGFRLFVCFVLFFKKKNKHFFIHTSDYVRPSRVQRGHRTLREEEWGSTIHHHPCGHPAHAAVHCGVCLLL